jgi:pyruvate/2-oxoglutarate dehydrogenase complex dihydrolipoamide dehydrogenase (E3) component
MNIKISTPENDVVVYGATSGGVATAIQCAKLGRKVVLVSPNEHIGRSNWLNIR